MLIKKLIDAGICFAIVQSYSFLTRGKITTNQQIEIIASTNDWGKLGKLGFQKLNDPNLPSVHKNPNGIISKELDLLEASEFRDLFNDENSPFKKILDNEDGKIYEVKGNSFKEKFLKEEKNRKPFAYEY